MKLASLFKILPKFLNAFKEQELDFKKLPDNFINQDYWDQECREHPTNNSCLIYCD
mgnify:CR=1 FL=1